MSQNVKGSFASGQSSGVGINSDALVIPSNVTVMKFTTVGLDASNTVKSQKSINNGITWVDQVTYNADQTNVSVTVANGEQWRLFLISQQALRAITFSMSAES